MSDRNKYGIGFWAGGGVYSIMNLVMNYRRSAQGNILSYNYLITGVAVVGLILNTILLKREKKDHKMKGGELTNQNKRYLEWALGFWMGIGLISLINVWKIIQNQNALSYSWIMFGISIIAIIICAILIKIKK